MQSVGDYIPFLPVVNLTGQFRSNAFADLPGRAAMVQILDVDLHDPVVSLHGNTSDVVLQLRPILDAEGARSFDNRPQLVAEPGGDSFELP